MADARLQDLHFNQHPFEFHAEVNCHDDSVHLTLNHYDGHILINVGAGEFWVRFSVDTQHAAHLAEDLEQALVNTKRLIPAPGCQDHGDPRGE
jgi:hypothetical protein